MRFKKIIKSLSKNQALGIAFFFWACLGGINYSCELENVSDPLLAIVYEIIINLDPIAAFKNGNNLDPDNFVNLFKKR